MGYYSRVKGTIRITRLDTPELPPEIQEELDMRGLTIASQYKALSPKAVCDIEEIENLHGYVSTSDRGLYGTNESNKLWELKAGLHKALEIIQADGCHAAGFLAVFGEESDDIWRLRIDGNNIIEEVAEICWPDGTKVDA